MPTLRVYPSSVLTAGPGFTSAQLANVLDNTTNYATYTGTVPVDGVIGATLGFSMTSLPDDALVSQITGTAIALTTSKNRMAFQSVSLEDSDGVLMDKTTLKTLGTGYTTCPVVFYQADMAGLVVNTLKDPSLRWTFLFRSLYGSASSTTRWQKAYLDVVYTTLTYPKVDDHMLTMHSV